MKIRIPIKYSLIFCLLISIGASRAFSAMSDSTSAPKVLTLPVIIDSGAIKNKAKDANLQNVKSPMGAVWRSLVLPGWGQIYTENYWKAPLFIGGAVVLSYFIVDNHNKYVLYRDKIDKGEFKTDFDKLILKSNREYYRDNRDQCGFYLFGVYLISAIDAYVDAHLFEFNVDDNLSFNFTPGSRGGMNVNCSLRLK